MRWRILISVMLTGALISPALAHTGVGQTNSFASGFLHPLSGADHFLAMTAIGLWGVLRGGRAIWLWPAAFVATLLGGFAAAALGLQVPFVEPAISLSVIVLGLCVALAITTPIWVGVAIAGLFAFFHGHAHGTEVATASILPYVAGFALATAWIHSAGIGLGLAAEGLIGEFALRIMGGFTVLSGVVLVAA
jgi:urease accessory protein